MTKRTSSEPNHNAAMHHYAVRIAATTHWSAPRRTVRVWADTADNARAEALRHRIVADWSARVVVYTKRLPR